MEKFGIFSTEGEPIIQSPPFTFSVKTIAKTLFANQSSLYLTIENGNLLLGTCVSGRKKRVDSIICLEEHRGIPSVTRDFINRFFQRCKTEVLAAGYSLVVPKNAFLSLDTELSAVVPELKLNKEQMLYAEGRLVFGKTISCITKRPETAVDALFGVYSQLPAPFQNKYTAAVSSKGFGDADLLVSPEDGAFSLNLDRGEISDKFKVCYQNIANIQNNLSDADSKKAVRNQALYIYQQAANAGKVDKELFKTFLTQEHILSNTVTILEEKEEENEEEKSKSVISNAKKAVVSGTAKVVTSFIPQKFQKSKTAAPETDEFLMDVEQVIVGNIILERFKDYTYNAKTRTLYLHTPSMPYVIQAEPIEARDAYHSNVQSVEQNRPYNAYSLDIEPLPVQTERFVQNSSKQLSYHREAPTQPPSAVKCRNTDAVLQENTPVKYDSGKFVAETDVSVEGKDLTALILPSSVSIHGIGLSGIKYVENIFVGFSNGYLPADISPFEVYTHTNDERTYSPSSDILEGKGISTWLHNPDGYVLSHTNAHTGVFICHENDIEEHAEQIRTIQANIRNGNVTKTFILYLITERDSSAIASSINTEWMHIFDQRVSVVSSVPEQLAFTELLYLTTEQWEAEENDFHFGLISPIQENRFRKEFSEYRSLVSTQIKVVSLLHSILPVSTEKRPVVDTAVGEIVNIHRFLLSLLAELATGKKPNWSVSPDVLGCIDEVFRNSDIPVHEIECLKESVSDILRLVPEIEAGIAEISNPVLQSILHDIVKPQSCENWQRILSEVRIHEKQMEYHGDTNDAEEGIWEAVLQLLEEILPPTEEVSNVESCISILAYPPNTSSEAVPKPGADSRLYVYETMLVDKPVTTWISRWRL